jgi:hypothetical protein
MKVKRAITKEGFSLIKSIAKFKHIYHSFPSEYISKENSLLNRFFCHSLKPLYIDNINYSLPVFFLMSESAFLYQISTSAAAIMKTASLVIPKISNHIPGE